MQGSPIDWDIICDESIHGRLFNLLLKLPRERWTERDKYGATFLHYACSGSNAAATVALLQSGLVDVNARDKWGSMPAHEATWCTQPRVLEVLCTAGADLRTRNQFGLSPIDRAAHNASYDNGETVHVLVANGVRLSTVDKGLRCYITSELEAFERGVLCCRTAVAAVLRVKRIANLWMWDKFLLKEIAICVWATRYNDNWQ